MGAIEMVDNFEDFFNHLPNKLRLSLRSGKMYSRYIETVSNVYRGAGLWVHEVNPIAVHEQSLDFIIFGWYDIKSHTFCTISINKCN